MAKYKYIATTVDGVRLSGTESALTPNMARRALLAKGLHPVEVHERRNPLKLELTKEKVPRKELMYFSRQMAVFMRSGISVIAALSAIGEEMNNAVLQRVLAEMVEDLRSGNTFSQAARQHPEAFPPFFLGILDAAEVTGNLDKALEQLSSYIERDLEARKRITSALTYPAVVLGMSLVSVVVIAAFVLPQFQTFFASLDAKLPLPTRMLLSITHFVSSDWFVIVGALLLFVTVITLTYISPPCRRVRDRLVLRVPVIGDLVRTSILERVCRILASMIGSGVPLPVALDVTIDAVTNVLFRERLRIARGAMLRGEGLADPLAESGLFPAAARQMLYVGEATGTMDSQLGTAAAYFDSELDYKLKQFTSLFEPAVIIFVGAIVGFVAVALVSAMYGIYHQVKV